MLSEIVKNFSTCEAQPIRVLFSKFKMHHMFSGLFDGLFVSSNVTTRQPLIGTTAIRLHAVYDAENVYLCALVKRKKGKLCWPLFRGPKSLSQEISKIIMQVEPIIIRFGCVEVFFWTR